MLSSGGEATGTSLFRSPCVGFAAAAAAAAEDWAPKSDMVALLFVFVPAVVVSQEDWDEVGFWLMLERPRLNDIFAMCGLMMLQVDDLPSESPTERGDGVAVCRVKFTLNIIHLQTVVRQTRACLRFQESVSSFRPIPPLKTAPRLCQEFSQR